MATKYSATKLQQYMIFIKFMSNAQFMFSVRRVIDRQQRDGEYLKIFIFKGEQTHELKLESINDRGNSKMISRC